MKILMLTSRYYPTPDANGSCCKKIADELIKKGHEVTIISLAYETGICEEDIYGVKVLRIGGLIQENRTKAKGILKKIKRSLEWPYISYVTIIKITWIILKNINIKKTNVLIPIIRPYDYIKVSSILQKINKRLKIIPYILDSLDSEINVQGVLGRLKAQRIKRLKKKILKISYKIAKMDYDRKENDILDNKSKYFDIPLIEKKKQSERRQNEKKISFIYGGILSLDYRDPQKFIELIKQSDLDIELKIYGKNDFIIDMIDEKFKNKIKYEGQVKYSELENQIDKAEFLVNFGNKGMNQLPSKIFEYISFGKPIIHVFFEEEDPTLKYLKHYPFKILLNMNNDLDELKIKLEKGIKELLGKTIEYSEIENRFLDNTPKPFSEFIENLK